MSLIVPNAFPAPARELDIVKVLGVTVTGRPRRDGVRDAVGLSVAGSHTSKTWTRQELDLDAVVERLMAHDVGEKAGSCWSPFVFEGDRRSADAALQCDLVVFDIDDGADAQALIDAVARSGYAAVVSSTHSHVTTTSTVSRNAWTRFREARGEPDLGAFLVEKGYPAAVAREAAFAGADEVMDECDDVLQLKHLARPRFRLVLFPERPWRRADYRDRHAAAAAYRDGLERLAVELGIAPDKSALDLARLYYDPRHPAGLEPDAYFVEGSAVAVWSGETVSAEGGHAVAKAAAPPDPDDGEAAEIGDGLEDVLEPPNRRKMTRDEFREAVLAIRNDERFDDRREWFKVVAAIHTETGGDADGCALAEEWSASWTTGDHDPEAFEKVWASLKPRRDGRRATGGTIVELACRDGWIPPWRSGQHVAHGDAWNGRRFAKRYRDHFLFVTAAKTWMRYENGFWSAVPIEVVIGLAKEMSADFVAEARRIYRAASTEQNKYRVRRAEAVNGSVERIKRMVESARSEPGMLVTGPHEFDVDPMLLGVENGAIDLRTGRLIQPSPDLRLSKRSRARFDPEARAPLFEKFLERIQPDPEMRAFLQRVAGYILTGSVDEEKLFFMYGTGANGKSVLANILDALLGDYAVTLGSTIIAKNKHENEAERLKARLPGRRLALANEVSQGDLWDDQRVKALASREKLDARRLHHEAFDFMPSHKLVIRGNHLPGALDAGHGFWRRMIPIHFSVQIAEEERIDDLDRRIISEELSGILNWAVEGAREWRANGLAPPEEIRRFQAQYRSETDVLGLWAEQCCEVHPGGRMTVAAAYNSYRAFCEEEGVKPPSKMAFSRMLNARGFERSKKTSERAFVGVSLKVAEHFEDVEDEE